MTNKNSRSGASLKISNDVLVKIAEVAATEIRGVDSHGEYLTVPDKGVQIAGKLAPPPVKVRIKNDAVEVSLNIVVLQGFKTFAVAKAVQESVKSAVQNMTGIAVSKVNVRIADIKLNPAVN